MSDDPIKVDEKRDGLGRFAPGHNPPASPGRPKLPDWFKSRGPAALRILVAQATGEAIPEDNGEVSAAVAEVASSSSTKVRGAAAIEIVNRVYGKAPDVIAGEPGAPLVLSVIRRVVVDPKG
jgi:hypothetical protein